jgi:hypothetical protein
MMLWLLPDSPWDLLFQLLTEQQLLLPSLSSVVAACAAANLF